MYKNLLAPITIRSMHVKNRVVMLPMGSNLGKACGEISDEHILYYEQRAKGGTGLIIVENACVDVPLGLNGATQIRIDQDCYIPRMSRLTETLHRQGACVALQMNHAGSSAVPERIGGMCVSSSAQPSKEGGVIPRSLEKAEIVEIAEQYGRAAKRAAMAGFDCVEIHCGHSYLISQFISPIFNKREDEFGGTVEKRAYFPYLVLQKVRAAVGPGYPISIRISAEDLIEGGNTIEDTLEILKYLDEFVDLYNVSIGLPDTSQYQLDMMQLEDGWRAHLSKRVREAFGKPTIAMGNIRDPQIAENILEEGSADFVGIGRGLIADPNWVNKVTFGQEELIRPCISCNIGCAGNRLGNNHPIHCTVNPDIIHEDEYKLHFVKKPTNVVVVGGGTAGMEAACTAAEVGCTVFLLEQKDCLGGLSSEISKLPNKKRIANFPEYLEKRMARLNNLFVLTGVKGQLSTVKRFKPNVIVNATGSKPLLPPIEGLLERIDGPNGKIRSITGLLQGLESLPIVRGKQVTVIGGGAVGLDVAEYFAEAGAAVTIVELLPMVGKDLDPITSLAMKEAIAKYNIRVLTKTKLLQVKDDAFAVENEGGAFEISFDFGMVCLGMKAADETDLILREYCSEQKIPYQNIGDSYRARKILNGVEEGRNVLTLLKNFNYI